MSINYTQVTTHVIALIVVIATIVMMIRGQQVPDVLIGAFGLVMGVYVRRQTEDDVHAQTERVLSEQVMVNDTAIQAR